MKVQKLTGENVKKIKSEKSNKLVKYVCDYIIKNWSKHEDKKNIFLDIMKYGCGSGACSDLITCYQTTKFYETFKFEINELLFKSDYDNLADLLGDKWDKSDPLALWTDNQNLLAWFAFEETIRNIAIKFGIE